MYAQQYWWNGWRTADSVAKGSPTQSSGRSSHLVLSWYRLITITRIIYACCGYAPKSCSGANLMVDPPLVNMTPSMVPECRKHTPKQTQTHIRNVKLIFSRTEPNIVAGDKLSSGTNPGFLKSEENVKLHTYIYTKSVSENMCL